MAVVSVIVVHLVLAVGKPQSGVQAFRMDLVAKFCLLLVCLGLVVVVVVRLQSGQALRLPVTLAAGMGLSAQGAKHPIKSRQAKVVV